MNIAPTSTTPSVSFDDATDTLSIRGESYPENAFDFYRPIQRWLDERLARGQFVLEVAMTYMNTSSLKCVMEMLDRLEAAHRAGSVVSVRWLHSASDERAREIGEELLEDVAVPSSFVVVP